MRPDLFVHALNLIENGKAAEECSAEINRVINAVRENNKKGTITLTLTVEPGGDGRYHLTHDVKTKLPPKMKYSTMVWGTPEGNLQKSDPAQCDIFVQDVSQPARGVVVDTTAQVAAKN